MANEVLCFLTSISCCHTQAFCICTVWTETMKVSPQWGENALWWFRLHPAPWVRTASGKVGPALGIQRPGALRSAATSPCSSVGAPSSTTPSLWVQGSVCPHIRDPPLKGSSSQVLVLESTPCQRRPPAQSCPLSLPSFLSQVTRSYRHSLQIRSLPASLFTWNPGIVPH